MSAAIYKYMVLIALWTTVQLLHATEPFPGKPSDFHGVARYAVPIGKDTAAVLCPEQAAAGRPWVLAYSLYRLDSGPVGNMTRTELELVKRGFHVVSLSLGNSFGAPDAIKRWDPLYAEMTGRYGLAKKPALMGLSREGLAIARWAAQHPDKVACLYMDKAVCDIKSWPGGKLGLSEGSPGNWESLLKQYHFASEAEALAFDQNPVDLAPKLAKAGIAMIYHAGAKDDAVPYAENGAVMEKAYAEHGGTYQLIYKEADGHHPHGLADPKPVVDFIQAHSAKAPPTKNLPVPGEVFWLKDRPAFVIPPPGPAAEKAIPWVWYAPTLRGLPGGAEKWMFDHFTKAGIAIAGIDVGESYGSPDGRALYTALYQELTQNRGFSKQPIMMGRSRGGLMALAWAAENVDKVGGFVGVYPVCNIASYPGIARAAGAYHLNAQELTQQLAQHNPVDRLEGLAKAGVPLFSIHGDVDKTVPLEKNSGLMKERYDALGGKMQLIIPPGQGHNMWRGFFECQELVDFVLKHAK